MSKKTTKKAKKQITKIESKTKDTDKTDQMLEISRIIRAPAERIYNAFTDPDAFAKFFPPHGFTGNVSEMNPVVGGKFKMVFKNFSTGSAQKFSGEYLELTPHSKIRYTTSFADPNMPGVIETIIDLISLGNVTEVKILMKGIAKEMPIQFAKMGWQESIQLLEQLVEPNIPDNP